MSDSETNKIILALAKLAKQRIFEVVPRISPAYPEGNDFDEPSSGSKSKRKKVSGLQKGSLLEQQYGYLNQGSTWLHKWLYFADKCCTK